MRNAFRRIGTNDAFLRPVRNGLFLGCRLDDHIGRRKVLVNLPSGSEEQIRDGLEWDLASLFSSEGKGFQFPDRECTVIVLDANERDDGTSVRFSKECDRVGITSVVEGAARGLFDATAITDRRT